ncbi:hypothetical protein IEQ34_007890 [Dendrobium chrysotoxum]|uniref:Uncharacterized protein n=1 Tax=Dendrobium chrysotoxum TaxID=161865 RepID=A0AAV7H713_DENCH|nr:hypothetical protein IEQ34_007890 [Dendrobium chrysotoxum]
MSYPAARALPGCLRPARVPAEDACMPAKAARALLCRPRGPLGCSRACLLADAAARLRLLATRRLPPAAPPPAVQSPARSGSGRAPRRRFSSPPVSWQLTLDRLSSSATVPSPAQTPTLPQPSSTQRALRNPLWKGEPRYEVEEPNPCKPDHDHAPLCSPRAQRSPTQPSMPKRNATHSIPSRQRSPSPVWHLASLHFQRQHTQLSHVLACLTNQEPHAILVQLRVVEVLQEQPASHKGG